MGERTGSLICEDEATRKLFDFLVVVQLRRPDHPQKPSTKEKDKEKENNKFDTVRRKEKEKKGEGIIGTTTANGNNGNKDGGSGTGTGLGNSSGNGKSGGKYENGNGATAGAGSGIDENENSGTTLPSSPTSPRSPRSGLESAVVDESAKRSSGGRKRRNQVVEKGATNASASPSSSSSSPSGSAMVVDGDNNGENNNLRNSKEKDKEKETNNSKDNEKDNQWDDDYSYNHHNNSNHKQKGQEGDETSSPSGLLPCISFRFPEVGGSPTNAKDKETLTMEESVKSFCFPDTSAFTSTKSAGWKIKEERFSFVLTTATGERRWGYCLRSLTRGDAKSEPMPQCFCFVSFIPCNSLFTALLDKLHQIHCAGSGAFDECNLMLEQIYYRPVPPPGGVLCVSIPSASPSQGKQQTSRPKLEQCSFLRPDDSDSMLDHVNFEPLLRNLSSINILYTFVSLLVERRMIFVADRLSTLSASVQAFVALLYPFTWQHIFIPVLPPSMLSFCCAPMPFVVGVLRDCIPMLQKMASSMEDIIVVDIDNNKYIPSQGIDDQAIIPLSATVDVLRAMESVAREVRARRRPFALRKNNREPQMLKIDKQDLCNAFIGLMVDLLASYRQYMTDTGFDRESFIKDQPEEMQPLLELLTESQMFAMFVAVRRSRRQEKKDMFDAGKFEAGVSYRASMQINSYADIQKANSSESLINNSKFGNPAMANGAGRRQKRRGKTATTRFTLFEEGEITREDVTKTMRQVLKEQKRREKDGKTKGSMIARPSPHQSPERSAHATAISNSNPTTATLTSDQATTTNAQKVSNSSSTTSTITFDTATTRTVAPDSTNTRKDSLSHEQVAWTPRTAANRAEMCPITMVSAEKKTKLQHFSMINNKNDKSIREMRSMIIGAHSRSVGSEIGGSVIRRRGDPEIAAEDSSVTALPTIATTTSDHSETNPSTTPASNPSETITSASTATAQSLSSSDDVDLTKWPRTRERRSEYICLHPPRLSRILAYGEIFSDDDAAAINSDSQSSSSNNSSPSPSPPASPRWDRAAPAKQNQQQQDPSRQNATRPAYRRHLRRVSSADSHSFPALLEIAKVVNQTQTPNAGISSSCIPITQLSTTPKNASMPATTTTASTPTRTTTVSETSLASSAGDIKVRKEHSQVFAGFLSPNKGSPLSISNSWDVPKWFVLTRTTFVFYPDSASYKPMGSVELRSVKQVVLHETCAKANMKPNCIEVMTFDGSFTYILAAPSAEVAKAWLHAWQEVGIACRKA